MGAYLKSRYTGTIWCQWVHWQNVGTLVKVNWNKVIEVRCAKKQWCGGCGGDDADSGCGDSCNMVENSAFSFYSLFI